MPRLLTRAVVLVLLVAARVSASDFVFVNHPYVQMTQKVIKEADAAAATLLPESDPLHAKYVKARAELATQLDDLERARALKKVKPEMVDDKENVAFAANLNLFKAAINYMADKAGKGPEEILPSYSAWVGLEIEVVKTGLEQRLDAFETRFGLDSEPLNILEFIVSQKYLAGDASGPSPWEPICRLTPIQATTANNGVTTSAQLGMNYYFVDRAAPKVLQWIGASNHVGVAAVMQYLEDPGLFNFSGKPSFGVNVHLDRKEVGVMWDTEEEQIRLNLGYAFQFLPFVM